MIIEGAREFITVAGVGIVGYIGSMVFTEIGKPSIAIFLNIITTMSAVIITAKLLRDFIDFAKVTFHLHF